MDARISKQPRSSASAASAKMAQDFLQASDCSEGLIGHQKEIGRLVQPSSRSKDPGEKDTNSSLWWLAVVSRLFTRRLHLHHQPSQHSTHPAPQSDWIASSWPTSQESSPRQNPSDILKSTSVPSSASNRANRPASVHPSEGCRWVVCQSSSQVENDLTPNSETCYLHSFFFPLVY